jgi:dolichol-phosphate mannosyltransferase
LPNPLISIVTPAHNEEGALERLVSEITAAVAGTSHEIVIIDDGSRDATWQRVQQLQAGNHHIRGARLTRNFGHQPAILAGLTLARGDAVITLDADGQHPASLIPALIARWREGHLVVQAVRESTQEEALFKRWTSKVFYRLFDTVGGPPVPAGSADFRLLARPVVQTVLDSTGPLLFLRGLVPWLGYPAAYVPYQALPRQSGHSSYTVWRMIRFSIHGLMSFSIVPLRLSILLGFAVAAFSLVYLLVVVVAWLTLSRGIVPGWASVMGLMSLLGGIQLIMIGVLGEYVGRMFIGQLNRPPFVVLEQI